jgi:PhzF family phenazine biosynthesis protein
MTVRVFQVDAFTDRPFAGNPAAVCLLDAPAPPAWMQAVATETDLPATAFVAPAPGGWALRWYAGRHELSLCGHGTLAASHVLLHEVGVATDILRYDTVAGRLTARSDGGPAAAGDGPGRWIELDLPANAPVAAPAEAPALTGALFPGGSAPAVETWRGGEDLLAVVPTAADVRDLTPDGAALAALAARVVIVSAAAAGSDGETGAGADVGAGAGVDFVSRVFAPSVGVPEDPVTGSAHCLLGPLWAGRLGRTGLRARQLSARGGELRVEVRGERVGVAGRAITVLRGELSGAAAPRDEPDGPPIAGAAPAPPVRRRR